jgi:HSP20 family protein
MWIDTRRNRLSDLDAFARRVDALFTDAFATRGLHGAHGLRHSSRSLYPTLTVEETDEAFTLTGDVPGLGADALSITVEGDVLTLAAGEPTTEEGWKTVRSERSSWSFERSLRFRTPIDPDGIDAALTNGVLTLTVPKRQPVSVTVAVRS